MLASSRPNNLEPLAPFNLITTEEILKLHIIIRRLKYLEISKPMKHVTQRHINLRIRQRHTDTDATAAAKGHHVVIKTSCRRRVQPARWVKLHGLGSPDGWVALGDPGGHGDDCSFGDVESVEGLAAFGDNAGQTTWDSKGEADCFLDDASLYIKASG